MRVRLPVRQQFNDKGKPIAYTPNPKEDPDYQLGGIKGSGGDVKKNHWAGFVLGQTKDKTLVAATIFNLGEEKRK